MPGNLASRTLHVSHHQGHQCIRSKGIDKLNMLKGQLDGQKDRKMGGASLERSSSQERSTTQKCRNLLINFEDLVLLTVIKLRCKNNVT